MPIQLRVYYLKKKSTCCIKQQWLNKSEMIPEQNNGRNLIRETLYSTLNLNKKTKLLAI